MSNLFAPLFGVFPYPDPVRHIVLPTMLCPVALNAVYIYGEILRFYVSVWQPRGLQAKRIRDRLAKVAVGRSPISDISMTHCSHNLIRCFPDRFSRQIPLSTDIQVGWDVLLFPSAMGLRTSPAWGMRHRSRSTLVVSKKIDTTKNDNKGVLSSYRLDTQVSHMVPFPASP